VRNGNSFFLMFIQDIFSAYFISSCMIGTGGTQKKCMFIFKEMTILCTNAEP
jgi:hypothetical protein